MSAFRDVVALYFANYSIGSFLISCTQNSVWEGGAWLSGVWHSNICQ